MQLQGVMTALVTPFKGGEVDYDAMKNHVKMQLDAGIHALVPLGSTGEAAALTLDEKAKVIETVAKEVNGQVPIIAGASTNATLQTLDLIKHAKEHGADAALVVVPFYNKPTQEGILAHFEAAAKLGVPIVAYNVPGRTGTNMTAETAAKVSNIDGIIALKEAKGDMVQAMEIIRQSKDSMALLSGEDALLYPFLTIGGKGLISVGANCAPKRFVKVYESYMKGDIETAKQSQLQLLPLVSAMFSVTNPIPVKAACHALGLCNNELRMPLQALAGEAYTQLIAKLKALEVVS